MTSARRPSAAGGIGPTLTGVGAVLLLAGISAVAGLLDVLAGSALRLIFAAGLVLGTLIASLLVIRRDLLTVFAPPLPLTTYCSRHRARCTRTFAKRRTRSECRVEHLIVCQFALNRWLNKRRRRH